MDDSLARASDGPPATPPPTPHQVATNPRIDANLNAIGKPRGSSAEGPTRKRRRDSKGESVRSHEKGHLYEDNSCAARDCEAARAKPFHNTEPAQSTMGGRHACELFAALPPFKTLLVLREHTACQRQHRHGGGKSERAGGAKLNQHEVPSKWNRFRDPPCSSLLGRLWTTPWTEMLLCAKHASPPARPMRPPGRPRGWRRADYPRQHTPPRPPSGRHVGCRCSSPPWSCPGRKARSRWSQRHRIHDAGSHRSRKPTVHTGLPHRRGCCAAPQPTATPSQRRGGCPANRPRKPGVSRKGLPLAPR